MSTVKDSEGFSPCPFCGNTKINMDTWKIGEDWYGKVSDEGCGMTFTYMYVVSESKEEAIGFYKRRWNMRAN